MRRFQVYRPKPPEGVQYEGIVFTDGTVAIRWRTEHKSHSLWESFDELMAVHGHPEYGTRVEWLDYKTETGPYKAEIFIDTPICCDPLLFDDHELGDCQESGAGEG
jgi:hypothetical protein